MKNNLYAFKAKVWLYKGDSPWHFVSIEKKLADRIKKEYIWPRRGFGSIRVSATLGNTTWKTSIFPDKDETFVLPLKKDVRGKENVKVGDTVTVSIAVLQ